MFCKHCGNELKENDNFCKKCGMPVGAQQITQPAESTPEETNSYQQPAQQSSPPVDYQPVSQQAQPTASPYAVSSKPEGDSPFVKALKNIPAAVKGYFIDSKAVISSAKKDKDIILASLLTVVLFLASLISSCFVFYGNDLLRYSDINFGLIFFNSFMVALLSSIFYTLVRFCSIKIFNKETNAKNCFIDSFIDFAFHSIPVAMIYIVGGIFGTFALGVNIALIVFAVLYYILVLVAGIKEEVNSPKNTSLFNLLVTLFIAIALAFVFYIIFQILGAIVMNTVEITSGLFGGLSSFGGLSNFSSLY